MPKIRKETSNRKKTNDRAKRRKQVKESKRKSARAAKKSVQWKSKTPKDPGIPSEFPYKDQILAEVAEQRRRAAEEKERKKADKQRALAKARAIARGEPFEDSDAEENEDEADEEDEPTGKITKKDLNVGAESIASLSAKFLTTELKPRPRPVAEEVEEEDDDDDKVPVLINRDLPNLKSVLEKADVILEVLDCRDPLAFRSKHIEQLTSEMGKKLLLIVNKIDVCPREAVASWSQYLRTEKHTLLFRSASSFLPEAQDVPQVKKGKGKAKIPVNDAVGTESILAALAHYAKEKKGDEPLAVAVVGVVNVGKSSLINSLVQRAALPVYTLASSSRGPTTTELPQEVSLEIEGQNIVLIDTPGLSFTPPTEGDSSDFRVRDILLRSKGRVDRLKDPNPPIVQIAARANSEDLMLLYSLPAFAKGDATAFLSGVARANQLVKKKGELDLTGAARIVLRDWSVGKLAHYTTAPSQPAPATAESSKAAQEESIAQLYAKDEAILAILPTRKERRKAGGLVKFSSGAPDDRQAVIEEHWASLQDSDDEEEGDADDVDAQGMDVDDEEEEDEEDEEEEQDDDDEEEHDDEEEEEEEEIAPPPPTSNKQKRKRLLEAQAPERPSKKVAFAPPTKHKKNATAVKHTPSDPTKQPLKSAQAPSSKKTADSKAKKASKAAPKAKIAAVKTPAPAAAAIKAKATNTASKTKTKAPKESAPEAYDFGKFF